VRGTAPPKKESENGMEIAVSSLLGDVPCIWRYVNFFFFQCLFWFSYVICVLCISQARLGQARQGTGIMNQRYTDYICDISGNVIDAAAAAAAVRAGLQLNLLLLLLVSVVL